MTECATETFEAELNLQALADSDAGAALGKLSTDKQFYGDLTGKSKGEMLSTRTGVETYAGYVAIEKVTGTLNGRQGTFVLQHSATISRGEQQLSIAVVPDLGTAELVGLAGQMTIQTEAGIATCSRIPSVKTPSTTLVPRRTHV